MSLIVTMKDQARLKAWAEPVMGVPAGALPAETICMGVLDGDEIRAVVSLNAFYAGYASIHIASDRSRKWLTRGVLALIFGYAFEFRGLSRLNLVVGARNTKAMVLALKLGALPEGILRNGGDDGKDAVMFSILADGCKWLRQKSIGESSNGQEVSTEA